MPNYFEKTCGRFYSAHKLMTAMLLLWSLLSVVFMPVVSLAETAGKTHEGMVYCPLLKTFQPVNAPKETTETNPFNDICAGAKTKNTLFREIIVNNISKNIFYNENILDETAFNFLAHGKSALEKLPNLPDLPDEHLVKRNGLGITVNNNYEHKFVWKQIAVVFLSELSARPPTVEGNLFFAPDTVFQSDEISRRIAPRAPPFFS